MQDITTEHNSNNLSLKVVPVEKKSRSDIQEIRYDPAHILATRKLLLSHFPPDEFQKFLAQSGATIAQDLANVDFDITLKTWHLINESNPDCLQIIMSDPQLSRQAQRKVLLSIAENAAIEEHDLPLVSAILFKTATITKMADFANLFTEEIETNYFLSLSAGQKYNVLKLLLINSATPSALFDWAIERDVLIDFSSDQTLSLLKVQNIASQKFKMFCGMKEKKYDQYRRDSSYESAVTYKTRESVDSLFQFIKEQRLRAFSPEIIPFIISCNPEFAVYIMITQADISPLTLKDITDLSRKEINFAVELMMQLTDVNLPFIPKDSIIRSISKQKTKDIIRFLPDRITDFSSLDEMTLWCVVRLIVAGIKNGEVETLYRVAKCFDADDYATMKFSNTLLTIAYDARHLGAGLCLADRFWRGNGIFPSRELAIGIYEDFAQHRASLLTVDAISRLSQHCILNAHQCYDEYEDLIDQIHSIKATLAPEAADKPQADTIKAAFGDHANRFFKQHKLEPTKKCEALQAEAKIKLEKAIWHLDFILNIDLASHAELKTHLGCLTAHMMMFKILFEQQDALAQQGLTPARERSLRAAWNYDALPGAVEELKNYLIGCKAMHRGSMETAIRSIKLDMALSKRPIKQIVADAQENAVEQPKLHRSHSFN